MRAWSHVGRCRAAANVFYPETKHTLKAGARTAQWRAGQPWALPSGVGSAFFINLGVAMVFDIFAQTIMRIRWPRPMRPKITLATRNPRAGEFMITSFLGFARWERA
jgi:hypothetical protein